MLADKESTLDDHLEINEESQCAGDTISQFAAYTRHDVNADGRKLKSSK
jgi:hypothetical protein